jgi:hypothetical protein
MAGKLSAVYHLAHLSLDTFQPVENAEHDARALLRLEPHLAVFTEAGQAETVAALADVAARRHYQLVNPDRGDIVFALRDDLEVLGTGGELAEKAEGRTRGHTKHGPRYNSFIRFVLAGEEITHSAAHILTGLGDDRPRTQQVLNQAELLASQIEDNADGRALSTGSADLNGQLPENAQLADIFARHRLTTTAAESGVDTPTHGPRRIDYIWTFDRDGRLSVQHFVVHRDDRFLSDHDPLEALLAIRAA